MDTRERCFFTEMLAGGDPRNFCKRKEPGGCYPALIGDVVLPGFEPGQAEPKTAVLPLHHKTILGAQGV